MDDPTDPKRTTRHRNPPSRFIARPSTQGVSVEDGDWAFLKLKAKTGNLQATAKAKAKATAEPPTRRSKRLSARSGSDDFINSIARKRSRRALPDKKYNNDDNKIGMRMYPTQQKSRLKKRKRPPPASAIAAPTATNVNVAPSSTLSSSAPRPPRVIIIGAGIAGLACARELSERRHDVLVLEARPRIGGRIRTIDLMLDKEWQDETDIENGAKKGEPPSELCKVRKWSPVDVGGQFIHGTGVDSTRQHRQKQSQTHHVGSHDFGTSRIGGIDGHLKHANNDVGRSSMRKSARLQQHHKDDGTKASCSCTDNKRVEGGIAKQNCYEPNIRKSDDGIGSLNPLYILARHRLRLPLHAVEGDNTCLVDHNGTLISDDVDRQVSEEFNNVLDLATRCCDEGKYVWKAEGDNSNPRLQEKSTVQISRRGDSNSERREPIKLRNGNRVRNQRTVDKSHATNYISDKTVTSSSHSSTARSTHDSSIVNGGDGVTIDPSVDFGEIFEECRRYYRGVSTPADRTDSGSRQKSSSTTANRSVLDDEVRENLFNWHVANLEMSSGAPMNQLGQKWNDDEPFGYGGDHSYLDGGFRDIIEALAEGFECRGVGSPTSNNNLRRSGDFASTFGMKSTDVDGSLDSCGGVSSGNGIRGVIQCGLEVKGVTIVERDEVNHLRQQLEKQPSVQIEKTSIRRFTRKNRGSKMVFVSRLRGSHQSSHAIHPTSSLTSDEVLPCRTSTYGNANHTVVHVTTACGLTLEADAVVVTVPLSILSIPPGSPGHIAFSPPLPHAKINALHRLGVGAYNKCCMSFENPFWNNLPLHSSGSIPVSRDRFDFIGHASSEHGKDILFFNMKSAPILIAIYGGSDYARKVEDMHDEDVVFECMHVLKKICANAMKANQTLKTRRQIDLTVPDWPIDYFVSRWESDPFSRGAFCYVPKGVDGFAELTAMATPMYDFCPDSNEEVGDKPKRPLILFAGEATTPYHPSTIHGAFETGIREAYRLDVALEPELNDITFDESQLYQPTFTVRRGQEDSSTVTQFSTNGDVLKDQKCDSKTRKWWFDNDSSILRGVESFGLSKSTLPKIKAKMMVRDDTNSLDDIEARYYSLMRCISSNGDNVDDRVKWELPGRRGTWLAHKQ